MSGQPEPTKISNVRKSLIREAEIEDRRHQIAIEFKRLKDENEALTSELGTLRTERYADW